MKKETSDIASLTRSTSLTHWSHLIVATLLAWMAIVLLYGAITDSATTDERAHLPAGISYVTAADYRLNPEHPPLAKLLSGAIADLVTQPTIPFDHPAWQNEVNGQWGFGTALLYQSGSNADHVLFWGRLPLILLTVGFGLALYLWVKREFGQLAALLTLFFYAFSPTLLAHGRYVTFDIAAGFGFFIGIITFLNWLRNPSWQRTIVAGLGLLIALLLKFSVFLLVPIELLLLLVWLSLESVNRKQVKSYLMQQLAIYSIAFIGIYLMYAALLVGYPLEKQLSDTILMTRNSHFQFPVELTIALVEQPLTRAIGHYALGLLLTFSRAAGGHTTYFIDIISNAGSSLYFPLLYLTKESLAFHILTLASLLGTLIAWYKARKIKTTQDWELRVNDFIKTNFSLVACLVIIALYWLAAVVSPLNIGYRHVLPTIPFIYAVIAVVISRLVEAKEFRFITSTVVILLVFQLIEIIPAFPHYLSYYNQLVGGTRNGYKIAVDSNYDWGQDFKRLATYMNKYNIDKIALDYQGGAEPSYYLPDRFESWWSARGPAQGWFAISITNRQNAWGQPVGVVKIKPEDRYDWLRDHEPVAIIGSSIALYRFD